LNGLFSRLAFTGFGPLALLPFAAPPPLAVVRGQRPSRLRDEVRRHGPRRPGVYGMVDAAGELIYVGKAKCLRSRLLSYFRTQSRDPKAGRILQHTRTIVWEPAPSEFAALLRELELIRRWQPRCNVHGQPRRYRRTYLCLGRGPAPYAFLAARPPSTAKFTFGPVPEGQKARDAVRRLNDCFSLRDCPQAQEMVFADQQDMFPVLRAPGCLRHEIGQCLGPCAGACSRGEYNAQVGRALAFLEGRNPSLLSLLERRMTEASAALAFERAAALRNKLDAVQWLNVHLQRVRDAARQSFMYAVPGHDGPVLWYLIHEGRVQGLAAANDAAAVSAVYAKGRERPTTPTADEIDQVLLVAGWFRRHPAEMQRTHSPEQALRRLVEQGQLEDVSLAAS
jgi:excinuclease ABC subunit C